MAKDYYVVLGVPLDAAPEEIRSAFRKLALRYHPDRRAGASPAAFRDVAEAYGVLSDPTRRARYDRERRRVGRPVTVSPAPPPMRDPGPLVSEPVPLAGEAWTMRPSLDAFLDRVGRNFGWPGPTKAEREDPLTFELILSREESERGVNVPFRVPVFSACSRCAGLGRLGPLVCTGCDGEGRLLEDDTIDIRVPAGVRDGTVIEASLERLGIANLWLRVLVRVEAA